MVVSLPQSQCKSEAGVCSNAGPDWLLAAWRRGDVCVSVWRLEILSTILPHTMSTVHCIVNIYYITCVVWGRRGYSWKNSSSCHAFTCLLHLLFPQNYGSIKINSSFQSLKLCLFDNNPKYIANIEASGLKFILSEIDFSVVVVSSIIVEFCSFPVGSNSQLGISWDSHMKSSHLKIVMWRLC